MKKQDNTSSGRSLADQLGTTLGVKVPTDVRAKKPSTDVAESTPLLGVGSEDVESGAVILEVLGVKKALDVLGVERASERSYGYRRAQDALRRAVDLALQNGVIGEAERLKERFGSTLLARSSSASDFDTAVEAAYEAVRCGAASRFIREAVKLREAAAALRPPEQERSMTPPPPPEWPEKEWEQKRAKDEYQQSLYAWAKQFTHAQVSAAGIDVPAAVARWFDKNRRATIKKREELLRKALADFEETGDPTPVLEYGKRFGDSTEFRTGDRARRILAHSKKWAWELVLRKFLTPDKIGFPPSQEWLARQESLTTVLNLAVSAGQVPGEALFRKVVELSGKTLGGEEVLVVPSKEGLRAISAGGKSSPVRKWRLPSGSSSVGDDAVEDPCVVYSTTPSPRGWVALRPKGASLYGPGNFNALQVALTCKKGSMDVRGWLKNYKRHPKAGFGLFDFWAVAGLKHQSNGWISVDDQLAERMDAILRLPDVGDAQYPDNIFFLSAEVGRVKKGEDVHGRWTRWASHLRFATTGEDTPSVAYLCHLNRDSVEGGSATFAEDLFEVTGGGATHLLVAILEEGQEVWLSSGLALRNEGGKVIEVPGGARKLNASR